MDEILTELTELAELQSVFDNITVNKNSNLLGNLNVNGNVGIGTTGFVEKLTMNGNIFVNTPNGDAGLRLQNADGTSFWINSPTKNMISIGGTGWTLPASGAVNVLAGGTVGIGTTDIKRQLHVEGSEIHSGGPAAGFSFASRSTGSFVDSPSQGERWVWYSSGKPGVAFLWSGRNLLSIDKEGNVGIGTETPKYTLDVNGTINASVDVVVGGGDCAEEFDIIDAESIEPGTVMVIDNNGALRASEKAYDKRVAGVISGAGDLRPGITLDKQANKASRLPLALTGKVYCKVDADSGAVEVGDLLTTSYTYGYAMKVDDHVRSIGAIIGKALRPLESGCGLIPILVALQ